MTDSHCQTPQRTPKRISAFLRRRRVWFQAAFLLIWLDPLMLRLHNVCGPVFHCYSCPLAFVACPIGVIANFSALHLVPFMAIGTLLLVGGLVGGAVCGWACPFGFIQDLAGKLPIRKWGVPRWLGYTRYAVLAGLAIAVPYVWGEAHALFFCRLCPAGALEGALPNTVRQAAAGGPTVWPNAAKLTILGLFVVSIFFVLRPWCRVVCPLGAIFGLFNRGSALMLRFEQGGCRSCGGCEHMCRYGVLPSTTINNSRCIRCLECTRCEAIAPTLAGRGSGAMDTRPAAEQVEEASPVAPSNLL